MYSCIFDVFIKGVEFSVLLIHHLDLHSHDLSFFKQNISFVCLNITIVI